MLEFGVRYLGQRMRKSTAQLGAWFLGPKAENADVEEGLFLHILRDYYHWRRNYYPADEITITQQMRRESLDWNDALAQQLGEILGALKRHFPSYSPRYVAHMMSDQTIPSVLGYFAGMLYNPNNVTPEAAPVTVQWELEVGADILRMLGYEVAPAPDSRHRETRREFGWAHITGGGTLANLESLWVARNVRYLPLAIKRACASTGIELRVKLPGTSTPVNIADLQDRECLALKPNEATFLLPRFTVALKHQFGSHRRASRPDDLEIAGRYGFCSKQPRDSCGTIGPFVLERSKPGAAAASCWFSHRMIPPNREGYGEIVRASLLAARELYERIVHWDDSCRANRTTPDYRVHPHRRFAAGHQHRVFRDQEKGRRFARKHEYAR